jgi:predicted TIM-barrel fold metal-dependent hydrolase
MLIDFHVHIGGLKHWQEYMPWVLDLVATFSEQNGLDRTKGSNGEIEPDLLLQLMDEAGLDYAVIVVDYFALDWAADFCSVSDRFIPYANLNPHLVAYPAREIEKRVKQGYRGLKFLPTYHHFYPNENKLYPFYDAAQELNLPMMYHIGSSIFPETRLKYGDPIYLDDVARDFKNTKIIMAHSGRGFWYDACFFLASFHPNVYMEITGLPPRNLLTYFPNLEKNADKILFCTDWPAGPGFTYTINEIRKLNLKPETKDKILGLNAASLLGIKPRLEDH